MNEKIKQQIDSIEIPDELHQRSELGVQKAKSEMKKSKGKWSAIIAAAASFIILIGGFQFLQEYVQPDSNSRNEIVKTEDGGFQLPAIKLPDNTVNANMIGLIVYNDKIYTQTASEIDDEHAKHLLGEKLGRTKGTIDEWSKQEDYAVEFASTIGQTDVFAVMGYDRDFRIMTYAEHDGEIFTEFYENLNGVTVYDGNDVFGKLNLGGNIESAEYQNYSDWYNSSERFYPINDAELLLDFANALLQATPYLRQTVEDEIGDFRNDDQYRRLTLQLSDGTKVHLSVIKDGYVYYGHTSLYFKIDDEVFGKIWQALERHNNM